MKPVTLAKTQSDFIDLLHTTIKQHKQYRIASDEGGAVFVV